MCSLQEFGLIGLSGFVTSLIDSGNRRFFFFLVQVSLLVAAFRLLVLLFRLGFCKLVLFLPVLSSWFDSSSWFFEIFHWYFCFWQKYSSTKVVNGGNSFEKVGQAY